eukprot:m.264447 g.264447  ORF g.264447 m.264447 type:complete len:184 (+) comp27833_c0_seq1:122-673(+)
MKFRLKPLTFCEQRRYCYLFALVCLIYVVGSTLWTTAKPAQHTYRQPLIVTTLFAPQPSSRRKPLNNIMVAVEDGVDKEILVQGSGPQCQKGQNITVHCTGTIKETNKKFWSTKDPGQKPFEFTVGVGKVIRGWDAGCLTMKLGETSRLTCRGDKAYGDRGFPAWGIGPNATLIFEIEILKIA